MPIKSDVAAVTFGLLSAASWGSGDFSGGVAAKRTNVYGVVVVSQLAACRSGRLEKANKG